MGIIYCVLNIKNKKKYIGQTVRSLEARRRAHLLRAEAGGAYFHRALNKYGPNAFIWGIVEEVPNELLDERETYYIALFNTRDKTKGYNQRAGGSGKTPGKADYKQRPIKQFICLYCKETFEARSSPAYFCPRCKSGVNSYKRKQAKLAYFEATGGKITGNTKSRKPLFVGPPKTLKPQKSKATGRPHGLPKGYTRWWEVNVQTVCTLCEASFVAVCGTAKFCPECKSKYNEKLLNKMYKAKYGTKPTAPFVNMGKSPKGVNLFLLTCTTCTKSFVCGTIVRKQCPECRGQAPTESCYMYEPGSPEPATV